MICHVIPPPSSRPDPDELMECALESCLIIKSRLDRDVEDEAELIKGQHRQTVLVPKKRKNAFGDLGYNY